MFLIVSLCVILCGTFTAAIPACDSEIWCHGPLLETVQNARLFPDSKTFVDMNLKAHPNDVLRAFNNLTEEQRQSPEAVRNFVEQYFDGPNKEFEHWEPDDYQENPKFLDNVKDQSYKEFGKDMCRIWSKLGRKIKQDVDIYPSRYSLLYLQNPFIVPGGRFRETYYWDSYWVIKGLLVCEMYDTVKGMLQNFVSLIKRYGMIPNGNRVYYTRRSQPPLFIPMVEAYVDAVGDKEFLTENIAYLEDEYDFWMTNRSVEVLHNGIIYYMNRYASFITEPRPESFREDAATYIAAPPDRRQDGSLYSNLASGAESGWDFSSRWFSPDYTSTENKSLWLQYTDTTNIIPVDLNTIICWNQQILSKLFNMIGNTDKADTYSKIHEMRKQQIRDVLWDSEAGSWFDYSIVTNTSRSGEFFPSNVFPLFAGCYNDTDDVAVKVLQYLQESKALDYKSGVPTSFTDTSQQWDFPNAWSPLQDVMITALANIPDPEAGDLAKTLANNWIASNYAGWKRTGHMFEKYVVTKMGSRGSGGEYDAQEGFGWTNGLVLDLLSRYGHKLKSPDSITNNGHQITPNTWLLYRLLSFCMGIFIFLWSLLEI